MPDLPTDAELDDLIKASNAFLKNSRVPARVIRIGNRLYLRATLPPKPGHTRVRPFQQKIALFLPVSKRGVKLAQAKAVKLGNEIIDKSFEWSDWWESRLPDIGTAGYWVSKFEIDYRRRNAIADRTWKNGWLQYLNLLPQKQPLTAALLTDAVLSKTPNTAQRKNICSRLQTLADFAGVDVDLSQFKGKYGKASAKARELPTDELISDWATDTLRIRDPAWRRVFGLIAAFGLRPHEAFLGELRDDGQYQVLRGKTGPRLVRPFYPEWVDRWDLWVDVLPDIDIDKAYRDQQLGNFVQGHLRRKYGLPFKPYDLRHAYAIRVHNVFGLSEAIGAGLMGHDVDVHLSTYQRWLSAEVANKAIDKVLAREDRPRPPL